MDVVLVRYGMAPATGYQSLSGSSTLYGQKFLTVPVLKQESVAKVDLFNFNRLPAPYLLISAIIILVQSVLQFLDFYSSTLMKIFYFFFF